MDARKRFSDVAACFRYTLHVLTWHRGDSSKIINKYLHNKIQALVYLWLEKPNIAGVDAFTELVCPLLYVQCSPGNWLIFMSCVRPSYRPVLTKLSEVSLCDSFFNLLTAPPATEEKQRVLVRFKVPFTSYRAARTFSGQKSGLVCRTLPGRPLMTA